MTHLCNGTLGEHRREFSRFICRKASRYRREEKQVQNSMLCTKLYEPTGKRSIHICGNIRIFLKIIE